MSYQLLPLNGGEPIRIVKSEVFVGRSRKENDVRLEQIGVSKKHGRLTWRNGQLSVEDLGSRNGVWVNGHRVQQAQLKAGDTLLFGPCEFLVELSSNNSRSIAPTPHASMNVEPENYEEAVKRILELAEIITDESELHSIATSAQQEPNTGNDSFADEPTPAPEQCHPVIPERHVKKSFSPIVETDTDDNPHVTRVAPRASPSGRTKSSQQDRSRSIKVDERTIFWVSPNWWRSQWSQHRIHGLPSRHVLVMAALATAALWWSFSTSDDAGLRLCRDLYQELATRREQGHAVEQSWTDFANAARPQLSELKRRLESTASASVPRKQALLYAVRDGLQPMFKDIEHQQTPLSEKAARREAMFLKNLQIASGELPPHDESVGGTLPTQGTPTTKR